MSEEELEQDDVDVSDEEEGEELSAADEDDDSADHEGTDSERVTPTPKKAKAKGKAAELEELPSLEAKQRERDELARAMEEYLARGGQVQKVEPNIVGDPPRKPSSKYGSRPI